MWFCSKIKEKLYFQQNLHNYDVLNETKIDKPFEIWWTLSKMGQILSGYIWVPNAIGENINLFKWCFMIQFFLENISASKTSKKKKKRYTETSSC